MQKLLLHVCCAPCATSVLERLLSEEKYEITAFFSNSNIMPAEEYEKRKAELVKLLQLVYPQVKLIEDEYNNAEFLEVVKGLETEKEGGSRCAKCIKYRLARTAQYGAKNGYDLFCTTLSVSPHKNAELINLVGQGLASDYGIEFLPANFKKQNGYLRSIELCKLYKIYRQNYCGCRLTQGE